MTTAGLPFVKALVETIVTVPVYVPGLSFEPSTFTVTTPGVVPGELAGVTESQLTVPGLAATAV